MSTNEWYRRTTWTDADREEFNAKLRRARQKPQYLRIQAVHLAEVSLWNAAIELLTQLINEFPDDSQLAQSQLQLAHAYANSGDHPLAIRAFNASLAAQRLRPNVRTQSWLLYPWFIVTEQMVPHYNDAEKVLTEFKDETSLSLPVERFRYHACKALLAQHAGKLDAAKTHAENAMTAASDTHSGFRYHPNIGLVQSIDDGVYSQLLALQAK